MKIIIVGGGPAGLLAAQKLVQRNNYEVHVYEKRTDMRLENPENLRSYPIGLQERGLECADNELRAALENAGKWIRGVALQSSNGTARKMPREPSLYLDRNLIVYTMLHHITSETSMSKYGDNSSLHLHFEHSIEGLDLDHKSLLVCNIQTGVKELVAFDSLIASDGANSIIRKWLTRENEIHVIEEDIPNHYRTFSIPLTSHDGSITLDDDRVHGWMFGPKTTLMVPNNNGYATGVFIYPREDDPFKDMNSNDPNAVMEYFQQLSPDSLGKFIGLAEAKNIIDRPWNYAKTAKCDRLHVRDCVLFLGDSAHAVSASVGQACNAALQDVKYFNTCLDELGDESGSGWGAALQAFSDRRLNDINALHELSDYSLPDGKDKWIQTEFIFRAISKKVLPTFITKYMSPMPNELLSTTNLSYSEILEQTEWWTSKVKASIMKRSPKINYGLSTLESDVHKPRRTFAPALATAGGAGSATAALQQLQQGGGGPASAALSSNSSSATPSAFPDINWDFNDDDDDPEVDADGDHAMGFPSITSSFDNGSNGMLNSFGSASRFNPAMVIPRRE